jgi:hypothetical protein
MFFSQKSRSAFNFAVFGDQLTQVFGSQKRYTFQRDSKNDLSHDLSRNDVRHFDGYQFHRFSHQIDLVLGA